MKKRDNNIRPKSKTVTLNATRSPDLGPFFVEFQMSLRYVVFSKSIQIYRNRRSCFFAKVFVNEVFVKVISESIQN